MPKFFDYLKQSKLAGWLNWLDEKTRFKYLPKKYQVFVLLCAAAGAVLCPLYLAQAQEPISTAGILISAIVGAVVGTVTGMAVGTVVWVAFFAVMLLASYITLQFANSILNWAVSSPFNLSMTSPSGNIMIELGWTLLRDFTSMLFVLGLAYIGLATALNFSNFNTKKTFVNLLIIALLVNFTPVICGVIVDIANIVTNFFVQGVDFSAMVGAVWDGFGQNFGFGVDAFLASFTKVILGFAYSLITGLILLAFAGLFLFRHVAIWLLVIASPLAFFAWIFPQTRKFFNKWWHQFFLWSFVGVPAGFFLYLAYALTVHLKDNPIVQAYMFDPSSGYFAKLVPHLIVGVFLWAGLFATRKVTPMGAKAALWMSSKAQGKLIGAAKFGRKVMKETAREGIKAFPDALAAARSARETGGGKGIAAAFGATGRKVFTGLGRRLTGKEGKESWGEAVIDVARGGAGYARRKAKLVDEKELRSEVEAVSLDQLEKDLEKALSENTLGKGNLQKQALTGLSIEKLVKADEFNFKGQDAEDLIRYMQKSHSGKDIHTLPDKRADLAYLFKKENDYKAKITELQQPIAAGGRGLNLADATTAAQLHFTSEKAKRMSTEDIRKSNIHKIKDKNEEAAAAMVLGALDPGKIKDLGETGSAKLKSTIWEVLTPGTRGYTWLMNERAYLNTADQQKLDNAIKAIYRDPNWH